MQFFLSRKHCGSMSYIFHYICLLSIFLLFACKKDSSVDQASAKTSQAIFKLRYPNQTNVEFVNQLEEGLNTNVLMYEYFYNGGGGSYW